MPQALIILGHVINTTRFCLSDILLAEHRNFIRPAGPMVGRRSPSLLINHILLGKGQGKRRLLVRVLRRSVLLFGSCSFDKMSADVFVEIAETGEVDSRKKVIN